MGGKTPPPAHSPQLHYEDKLHEVDHFQEIIGFKEPHGFQHLGEAQQHDVPSQPAEGERPVRTCHAGARARPRRLSEGRRSPRPGGSGAMPAASLKKEPAGRPLPPAAVTGRWAHPQAPARRRRPGPARRTAAPWRDGGKELLQGTAASAQELRSGPPALHREHRIARGQCGGAGTGGGRREPGERDGSREWGTGST